MPDPRILVCDGDAETAAAIAASIRRLGYDATTATTGDGAVALVRNERPDLVVVDVGISGPGGRSGIEVARELQTRFGLPVVFTTADVAAATIRRVAAAEPFGCLAKPVRDADLRGTLEVALARAARDRILAAFSSAIELDALVAEVARAFTTTLADGCVVRVREGDRLVTRAVHAVDPTAGPAAVAIAERGDAGDPSVLRIRLRAGANDVGVLVLVRDRAFEEVDVASARSLSARAAIAIDHALRYRAERLANVARGEELATAAHELRSPLSAILGWSSLLESGVDLEETREGIDAIARAARSLRDRIEDLLDAGRIATGRLRIADAPVDVVPLVRDLVDEYRPLAATRGVSLSIDGRGARDDARVRGDAERLRQVFANLLTNALKFTPKGGTIAFAFDDDGESIAISVVDDGVGIDPADLPRVFDLFAQAGVNAGGTRARSGGLGIGLAIVRRVVELHGGSATAWSAGRGRGTTVTIRLPKADAIRRSGVLVRPSVAPAATG